eukprot:scaffold273493_cov31-Tisochrysis_lutea.AAC.1
MQDGTRVECERQRCHDGQPRRDARLHKIREAHQERTKRAHDEHVAKCTVLEAGTGGVRVGGETTEAEGREHRERGSAGGEQQRRTEY